MSKNPGLQIFKFRKLQRKIHMENSLKVLLSCLGDSQPFPQYFTELNLIPTIKLEELIFNEIKTGRYGEIPSLPPEINKLYKQWREIHLSLEEISKKLEDSSVKQDLTRTTSSIYSPSTDISSLLHSLDGGASSSDLTETQGRPEDVHEMSPEQELALITEIERTMGSTIEPPPNMPTEKLSQWAQEQGLRQAAPHMADRQRAINELAATRTYNEQVYQPLIDAGFKTPTQSYVESKKILQQSINNMRRASS